METRNSKQNVYDKEMITMRFFHVLHSATVRWYPAFCAALICITSAGLTASAGRVKAEGDIVSVDEEAKTFLFRSEKGDEYVVDFSSPKAIRFMVPGSIKDLVGGGLTAMWGDATADRSRFTAERIMTFRPARKFTKGRIIAHEASGLIRKTGAGLQLTVDDKTTVPLELAEKAEIYVAVETRGGTLEPGMRVEVNGNRKSDADAVRVMYLSVYVPADQRRKILGELDVPEDYLRIVRHYADAMIERGRDTYGSVKSPLFAVALDPVNATVFQKKPGNLSGIRNGDRVWQGANPMTDQNFYQVLYALSEVTGDGKYAAEADAALRWFFENCQSPRGLMSWGEHQGWDFYADAPVRPEAPHEFAEPWMLWEKSFALAPEACDRFAHGLWEHQIGDHEKGLFSRHAMATWRPEDDKAGSSRTGHEFPRHGGFYIATWAEAYARTKDPEMLKAIRVLVDGFEGRRSEASGAIPSQSSKPELMWPFSNISLAIDMWDAAPDLPEELSRYLRESAKRIDEVFLKIAHEPGPGGKGFVKSAITSTLEPGDIRAIEAGKTKGLRWQPYATTWATGYGAPTDAKIAMICLMRYRQSKDDRYKSLFMQCADKYVQSEPPRIGPRTDLFPGALAEAIAVQTNAYRLSRDNKYLERAEEFAKIAIDMFFDRGRAVFPAASAKSTHYETITGSPNLAMQLLDLWAVETNTKKELDLPWTVR